MKMEKYISAEATPSSSHFFISHLPPSLSKNKEELERENGDLEVEVEDGMEATKSRSSSHQAQVILISTHGHG